MSSHFTISNGVPQGGILSPSLFTVCRMVPLHCKIRACKIYHIDNVSINHVFYADDLCLMAHCAIALQELITVCYQYSNKIDLNFNSIKSICFAFTTNYYILSLSPLFMNSLSLLYADTIKYF